MRTAEIKKRFLDHFEQRGHTVVPSSSLLSDDPTLLFTVAGMVPFIPYLTGQQTPPYDRAVSVQKCVRTLDIDEVGKTARHGTFFQMNGNFSFGDYFKEQAIEFAWELLTSSLDNGGFGLDGDRIWATVFHEDDEAIALWRKVTGIPEARLQRRGMDDNYWSTGVAGPAGPSSEIFYDRGPAYGPDGGPVVDEERFLEIWNLVFMQTERGASIGPGKSDFPILGELPSKNIDTGMGMERVAYLLQDKENLYEIDEVFPVIAQACELSGRRYGVADQDDIRLRVIGDHVRSGLMLIGDGVTPGNEGRGYVLRRLLRRAIRAMRLLGYGDPALPALLPVSRDCMSPSYPEIGTDFARISDIAYAEEEAFAKTLESGTTILDTAVSSTKASARQQLSGQQAFALHDTYGFPFDLTLEMAQEQGVSVDEDGFRALMKEQRDRARSDAMSKRGARADTTIYRSVLDRTGPTEWLAYTELSTSSRVVAVLDGSGPITAVGAGSIAQVALDRTPFYAESGGQDADAGEIRWDGGRAEVIDVQRPVKGLVLHQVRVLAGELVEGLDVEAVVDPIWRLEACQAHSGTHVIHAALREVLGPNALQSGSYNRPGYLRLDFSWRGALRQDERDRVERVANLAVRDDLPVRAEWMSLPQARERGALALFGETYGDDVRVVEIGGPWSRELCGGTHVGHSSQIGPLAITSEASVGTGARRVEAVVGAEAFGYLARERDVVRQLADLLKAPRADLADRVADLMTRLKTADREIAALRAQASAAGAGDLLAGAQDVAGVALVAAELPDTAAGDLRTLASDLRGRLPADRAGVVVLISTTDGKVALVSATNAPARALGVSAADLLRAVAEPVGGRGGGKDDLAQGGGTDPAGIPAALERAAGALADAVAAKT